MRIGLVRYNKVAKMGRKDKEIVDNLIFIIEALDGYRVGRNVDPGVLEKKMNYVEPIAGKVLDRKRRKVLLSAADYMINLPAKSKSARTWSGVFLISRLLIRVTFVVFLVSVLMYFISPPSVGNTLLITGVVLFYMAAVMRWYSLNKLLDFYERQSGRADAKRMILRKAVKDLILFLRGYLEDLGVRKEKVKLHLYNVDYEGIVVLKRPGWLRDNYIVVLS